MKVRSATWNLGTTSAFAVGPRKTTENVNRVGQSQCRRSSSLRAYRFQMPNLYYSCVIQSNRKLTSFMTAAFYFCMKVALIEIACCSVVFCRT
jgi:hypothetical protein